LKRIGVSRQIANGNDPSDCDQNQREESD
jgi:hypothetical protein